jgi:hypothetical protein
VGSDFLLAVVIGSFFVFTFSPSIQFIEQSGLRRFT